MPITDIYSKRQKRMRGEVPDILVHDDFPMPLRRQITQIFQQAITEKETICFDAEYEDDWRDFYEFINGTLCHEYGIETLNNHRVSCYREEVFNFLLTTKDVEQVIDTIELCCQTIDSYIRYSPKRREFHEHCENNGFFDRKYVRITPDEALSELNERLKEHGVGYQYENGSIIRVDCTVMHAEVTKPTLRLLHNDKFKGAEEEYLKAHEHYRHGRNEACTLNCGKALEITIKTICTEKSWQVHVKKPTLHKLIGVCVDNNLIPPFLRSLFESGVPPIRNIEAHAKDQYQQPADEAMARFCLNLTGANIIFLVEKSGIK